MAKFQGLQNKLFIVPWLGKMVLNSVESMGNQPSSLKVRDVCMHIAERKSLLLNKGIGFTCVITVTLLCLFSSHCQTHLFIM